MNTLLITISEAIEIIEQNFQTYRGDDFELELTFTNEDGEAVGLTDWTIFFTSKQSKDLADDTEGVVKKEAIIDEDPTTGKAKITLTSGDTNDLLGVYYYDIQYKDSMGTIKTVVIGKLVFSKDITRRTE